jgi:DNA-directed RNA polymerase subunit E'/Rpb7
MEKNIDEKVIGPYFNTSFNVNIGLHPVQMRKNIYENLKNNLIKKYQNKCFNMYGYISKIYNISDIKGGLITPENSLASAIYNVKFQCKICRPLKGSMIIFEVLRVYKALIYLVNGPIQCIIFDGSDKINKDNFFFDESKDMYIGYIDQKRGMLIKPGTFVKVKCIDTRIDHKRILIMGILDSVANNEEIKKANIEKELEDKLPFYEFDDYIENDQQNNEVEEINNDDNIQEDSAEV